MKLHLLLCLGVLIIALFQSACVGSYGPSAISTAAVQCPLATVRYCDQRSAAGQTCRCIEHPGIPTNRPSWSSGL